MKEEGGNKTIKSWATADQPIEKLMRHGRTLLTDTELLAIILRSGSRDESAVALAKTILASVDNNLHALGKLSVADLMKFKGVGKTKAVGIISALEIGRRRRETEPAKRRKVTSSHDAYLELRDRIYDLDHEQFWILLLNRSNEVVEAKQISIGGVSGTVVDAKIIFKAAIDALASGIILCHNHPSGNLNPSKADIAITKKLKEGAKQLDVTVHDHIIISEKGYTSLADEGMM